MRCFYREIGIRYVEQKQERMIVPEMGAMDEVLFSNIKDMQMCIDEGIEKMNSMFGTKSYVEWDVCKGESMTIKEYLANGNHIASDTVTTYTGMTVSEFDKLIYTRYRSFVFLDDITDEEEVLAETETIMLANKYKYQTLADNILFKYNSGMKYTKTVTNSGDDVTKDIGTVGRTGSDTLTGTDTTTSSGTDSVADDLTRNMTNSRTGTETISNTGSVTNETLDKGTIVTTTSDTGTVKVATSDNGTVNTTTSDTGTVNKETDNTRTDNTTETANHTGTATTETTGTDKLTDTLTETVTNTGTVTDSGTKSNTNSVSAFNTDSFAAHDKTDETNGNTRTDNTTATNTHSGGTDRATTDNSTITNALKDETTNTGTVKNAGTDLETRNLAGTNNETRALTGSNNETRDLAGTNNETRDLSISDNEVRALTDETTYNVSDAQIGTDKRTIDTTYGKSPLWSIILQEQRMTPRPTILLPRSHMVT